MKIGVLIPYRGTTMDKSRLRKNLSNKIVDELLYQMTQQILKTTTSLSSEYNTYLLTKNESIKFNGDFFILKDQGYLLNDSLRLAVDSLKEDIILIIMADLPLIQKDILKKIINFHNEKNEVIIAPSYDNGTSLLCFDSKQKFPFVFGCNSALEYQRIFTEKNIDYRILKHEIYYRDIDTHKDLSLFKEIDSIPNWLKKIVNISDINERKSKENTGSFTETGY